MARITKKELEAQLKVALEDLEIAKSKIVNQADVVAKAKAKAKETRAAKTKATKLEKELFTMQDAFNVAEGNALKLHTQVTHLDALTKEQHILLVVTTQKYNATKAMIKEANEAKDEITTESHDLILKLVKLKTKNPVKAMKNWLEGFKEKNNSTYLTVYIVTMVLLGITLASSAFGFGSLVKMYSTIGAGAWTFNIINSIYIGLFVYAIGEFQGWWSKLKEKMSKKK